MSSWIGTRVRHQDGRTGVIARDDVGFMHRLLKIVVDGGGVDYVQLNVGDRDSGSRGWEWLSAPAEDGHEQWCPLGDHNQAEG